MTSGRSIWLLGAAGVALLGATAPAAASETLEKVFASPPAQARPFARWWWPGGAVSDPELAREIAIMAKAGFGGVEIQAFNPGIPDQTADERKRVNDYANPAFFGHVRAASQAAAREGLKLDYTFGSAWPSGGGFAVTPELALVELTMATTQIDGPPKGPLQVKVPKRSRKLGVLGSLDARTKDPRAAGWRERLDAREKLVAVIAVPGDGPDLVAAPQGGFRLFPWQDVKASGTLDMARAVVLTDKLSADGVLDWTPPAGRWQIFVFKQYAVDSGVMAGVGEGPQLVLDHYRKAAFEAHASRVGAPLVEGPLAAGPNLNATFVDSLELMQDLPWTDAFLAEFKQRRGYDLTPYLPLVLQPGWVQAWDQHYSPPYFNDDALGERVRADYRRTLSDLQLENFWQPFVAWNHARGLRARIQAHGAGVDVLKAYGLADIPETEDLDGDGNPVFLRMARSAADLYGRNLVSAESFVFPAEPYDVTPERIRQRADKLFASGVNRIVYHGYPYVVRANQRPGWHPFAPSGFGPGFSLPFNELNPIFAAAPQLNAYIARTQAVLQQGRNVVPVALYLGDVGYFHGLEPQSRNKEGLETRLLAAGFDNDRINPDALSDARVIDGDLVTRGGGRYQVLVMPPRNALDAATAQTIARLSSQGLKVVFVDVLPSRHDGLEDAEKKDRQVVEAVAMAQSHGAQRVSTTDLPSALLARNIAPNLNFEGPGALFVERATGKRRSYFLHNTEAMARSITFTTSAKGRAEIWDAWTGARMPINSLAIPNGSRVKLDLPAGGSALVVFDPSKPAAKAASQRTDQVKLELPGQGWKLTADGYGLKGAAVSWSSQDIALGDWSGVEALSRFSGQATYTRTLRLDTKPKGEHWLDLGQVHDMATVRINGMSFAPLIGPYRVKIGKALKAGDNLIEITVRNTPNNAMVEPANPARKHVRPQPAGLIGPVRLLGR
ncbi:glycosyl hydrolase [Caulobacter sp. Root343]|uniref:glycosyl hydrolase n=1 Tax=Caulobacter sp. Root343 TaxID=1736520 RepID=UPI0009EB779A|nr:glycosyl hydrolase [Caulobacter sp. Root343]